MKNRWGIWLTFLFAAQPVLDVLAFFNRNQTATVAGYIRLVILVLLPILVLFCTKEKKRFLIFIFVTGLFCSAHVLNCWRLGYINWFFDIHYLANVVQMPLFAVCFLLIIRDEELKLSALRGVAIAAILSLSFLVIARLTHTGNVTYGEGLGYSGWVIDDNRNANSTNLVIYACFSLYLTLKYENKWLIYLIPAIIDAVFLSNGTKGCYFSIFVIFICNAAWLVLVHRVLKTEFNKRAVMVLLFLSVFSAVIYPWTPRYKVTESQAKTAVGHQGEIEASLLEKGIDITDMSPQERFDNPEVKAVFEHYYWIYLGVKPDIVDRFGMDRVLMQYRMTTDVAKLIDARIMERNYADMIFEDCDLLSKFLGFEASEIGFDGIYDLENDWHSIFYYYGYLGFALYFAFMLYFLLRVVRTMRKRFFSSFTLENFSYLLTLTLIIGLAHFSGAVLRRPNVSIWLSLVLALIYYVTEDHKNEAEYYNSGV